MFLNLLSIWLQFLSKTICSWNTIKASKRLQYQILFVTLFRVNPLSEQCILSILLSTPFFMHPPPCVLRGQDQVETPSLQPQFSLFLPASWGGFNLSRDSVLWGYHISSTCVMSHPQVSFSPRLEDVSIKDYLRRDSVLWEYFINMCRCLSQASPSEVKNLTPPPPSQNAGTINIC